MLFRLFVRLFVSVVPFVGAFDCSFVRSFFVRLCVCSLVGLLVFWFIRLFVVSFVCSFVSSLVRLFVCSFVRLVK